MATNEAPLRYEQSGLHVELEKAISQPESTSTATVDSDIEAQKEQPKYNEKRTRKTCTPNPRTISDAILGLSDGLTVPFALTAGLSALGDTKVVVLGGLAELIAGAISMGLGGYVGARSEMESYQATLRETDDLILHSPATTSKLVHDVLIPFGIPSPTIRAVYLDLATTPLKLRTFLVMFHHNLSSPAANRAIISAMTLALGYFIGGFIPLLPYFCVKRKDVILALYWSIGIMAVTLFAFGYVKTAVVRGWSGRQNVVAAIKGAVQMVVVGAIAAGAAIGLVRAIDHGISTR